MVTECLCLFFYFIVFFLTTRGRQAVGFNSSATFSDAQGARSKISGAAQAGPPSVRLTLPVLQMKATDSICRLNKQTQGRSPDVETHTDPDTLPRELVCNKLPVGVG